MSNLALKIAILRSGATQYALARELDITETRMSRICCGRESPTQAEAARLAEILNIPASELLPDTSAERAVIEAELGGHVDTAARGIAVG